MLIVSDLDYHFDEGKQCEDAFEAEQCSLQQMQIYLPKGPVHELINVPVDWIQVLEELRVLLVHGHLLFFLAVVLKQVSDAKFRLF